MADELDKMLDAWQVKDADPALLERIVKAAEQQPANENTPRLWLRRAAMLAVTAVMGFWLGNATIPQKGISTAAGATAASKTSAEEEYMERMIWGPQSADDLRL